VDAALLVDLPDFFDDTFKLPGDFGDQDDIRATGNAGFERDVASIAAHDFKDHDAAVAGGGGLEAIDRFCGYFNRRIEADGDFGDADVVVHCFGDADE